MPVYRAGANHVVPRGDELATQAMELAVAYKPTRREQKAFRETLREIRRIGWKYGIRLHYGRGE